jgi:hypothetical protein
MSPADSPNSNHLPDAKRTCPRIGLQINTRQKPFRWSEIRQLAVTAEQLVDGLRRCAEAGMDEVMLIVDPPTPEALETVARAAALAGAG